jgi:hypothetical protein
MNRSATILSTIVLAAALSACGSNPAQPEAAATAAAEGRKIEGLKVSPGVADIAKKEGKVELTKDERVKCEKYKPLGSNRTQYRCVTLAEQKATEQASAEEMRKLAAPPPSATGRIGN